MFTISPFCTGLSVTSMILAAFSCSFLSSASISSSVGFGSFFSKVKPLYSPRFTSGLTQTSAVNDTPFSSIDVTSISGLATTSRLFSATAAS